MGSASRGQLAGAKFRRQHQFGRYILDFYCHEAKLVIELDGAPHFTIQGRSEDAERSAYLESCGLEVLRFTNHQVLADTEHVVKQIWQALDPHPSPLPEGEGDRIRRTE